MGIRSLSTASISTGTKRSKVWDQSAVVIPPNSFESIATTTVGAGGSSTITFSSIPTTYKHLQMRCFVRATSSVTDCESVLIRFNSDSGANYNRHYLIADGSAVYSGSSTPTSIDGGLIIGNGLLANTFSPNIVDILDYNDTNKNTTVRVLSGGESNSNNSRGYVEFESGLWRNTSAVTSITLTTSGTAFAQYSQIALYGIKG